MLLSILFDSTPTSFVLSSILVLAATYIIYEQTFLLIRRLSAQGSLSGPVWTWPLIGGTIEMVMDPYSFWIKQRQYGPLSWNSLAGFWLVHSASTATTRKIFQNNQSLVLKLHPNAETILGSNNIAFMQGEKHLALRKRLTPLFNKRALSVYLERQQKLIQKHLNLWFEKQSQSGKTPLSMRAFVRDLNVETSQGVFMGTYLTPSEAEAFHKNYHLMNEGMLGFPLALPGTALSKAVPARKEVVAIIEKCVKQGKEKLKKGGEPDCLLDFWLEIVLKELADNEKPPEFTDDHEIACLVLDFLFASQDASTASLVWIVTLLANNMHPEVAKKCREEQRQIRPNGEKITIDNLNQMNYALQVVKETLRFRPPATMVPMEVQDQKGFEVNEKYTAPKGTLLIPDIWAACFEGFPEPEKFDPDRFSPERNEFAKHGTNWLPFGLGPHYCMGRDYAQNHLMCFLAELVSHADWERTFTPDSDKVEYGPTIFPKDSLIHWTKLSQEQN